MDRLVTAFLGADRPGAADVAAFRADGVVTALAVRPPDGMDRRQVDHVEPELRELRQDLLDACEAAERPGEQLVPGAEAGERHIGVDAELDVELHLVVPVVALRRKELLERHVAGEQGTALRELTLEFGLAALDLPRHLVLPRRDPVDPRGDRVRPAAGLVEGERAAPLIVAERLERRLAPATRARASLPNRPTQHVVPRAEDRRVHDELVADDSLDREAPAVHLRLDVLDLDAGRRGFARARHGHETFAPDETETRQWSAPASDVAAWRPARRRGVRLCRLARGGRAIVVAGAAARPSRHR